MQDSGACVVIIYKFDNHKTYKSMKKIFAILVFFAIAITAVAQVPNKENLLEHSVTFTDSDQAVAFEQFAFSELLKRENSLLKQRSIATIITLSGGVVTTVGMVLRDGRGNITNAGAVLGSIGLVTTVGAGAWLIVNEFQLISTRRKINEKMVLRVTPTGVALQF